MSDCFVRIPIAYLSSCAAAWLAVMAGGGVYDYVTRPAATAVVPAPDVGWSGPLTGFLVFFLAGTIMIAIFALVPAVVAIVYMERKKVRSIGFHGAAGAAAGIVGSYLYLVALMAPAGKIANVVTAMPELNVVSAAAGVVAGMVYWSIAGRTAGRTLPVR